MKNAHEKSNKVAACMTFDTLSNGSNDSRGLAQRFRDTGGLRQKIGKFFKKLEKKVKFAHRRKSDTNSKHVPPFRASKTTLDGRFETYWGFLDAAGEQIEIFLTNLKIS